MSVITSMTLVLITLYIFRKTRKFWLLIAFALTILPVKAITIKGAEPAYAGRTLPFMTWTDPVSRNEKPVFTIRIDENGSFRADVPVTEKMFCYCDFGIYRGEMILVPGEDILLQLPPLRDKTFGESKNPYFEPAETWLMVNGGSVQHLTNQISRFDDRFYQLSDRYFNQIIYRQLRNYRDTISMQLDKEFSDYKDPWFRIHRSLRLTSLEADITRAGREKLMASVKPVTVADWNQPAFTELLNTLFVNTLSIESKSIQGSKLKQWIIQKNIPALIKWTNEFSSSSPPLSDLLLLKMLHDAFYSGDFSKQAILQIIGSEYFRNNSRIKIKEIASETGIKLSFLEKGSKAPEICLPTLNSTSWCSTGNSKPYLYLLFADLDIPVCREQVKYLKTMAEKTGETLQIALVVSPSEKTGIQAFIKENAVPGIVMIDGKENPTGRQYKVRSYPSAFLLDKGHRVVMAPAKTPLDGFEFQFEGLK